MLPDVYSAPHTHHTRQSSRELHATLSPTTLGGGLQRTLFHFALLAARSACAPLCKHCARLGAGGAAMQTAVLKLKQTQAALSKLSVEVRDKVAAKKKARAASREAKNASATLEAPAAPRAADEGAGSSSERIRKAANKAKLLLRATLSKKGRCAQASSRRLRSEPCFTPPWRRVQCGGGQGRGELAIQCQLPRRTQRLAVA